MMGFKVTDNESSKTKISDDDDDDVISIGQKQERTKLCFDGSSR